MGASSMGASSVCQAIPTFFPWASNRPQRDQRDQTRETRMTTHASEGGRSVRWVEKRRERERERDIHGRRWAGRKMGDVGDGQKGKRRNEAEVGGLVKGPRGQ